NAPASITIHVRSEVYVTPPAAREGLIPSTAAELEHTRANSFPWMERPFHLSSALQRSHPGPYTRTSWRLARLSKRSARDGSYPVPMNAASDAYAASGGTGSIPASPAAGRNFALVPSARHSASNPVTKNVSANLATASMWP